MTGRGTVAVDSSVLLDVVLPDAPDRETSRRALNDLARTHPLVLSPVVLSEVACQFESQERLRQFFEGKPLELLPDDREVAWWASRFFRRYVRSGKPSGTRKKILPDFFVAAHAHVHADSLLTRDEDFKKSYFEELTVHTPASLLE